MAKFRLTETLEALQEYDFMGGPGMEHRPDYTTGVRGPRNAPKNFRAVDGEAAGEGPLNAQGRGMQGVGRGGVGWGGRPDDSGGVREPSSTYDATWQNEGTDWDEEQRHGAPRNKWRDTDMGKQLKKMVDGEAVDEAMGVPFNQSMAYGHAGNMTGGTGPGMTVGWNRSPNLGDNDEEETMNLREFFDPKPIPMEEIDNPEQENHGDSTDAELEAGDDDGIEMDGAEDDDGLEDLVNQLTGMGDTEPGDGDDIGQPAGNIMLTPRMGSSEFVTSPDRMGSARGTFGMHTDGMGHSSTTEKSSAWDVLKKVVDAMSDDSDAEVMNPNINGR